MKTHQPAIFAMSVKYKGKGYEVKALKYTARPGELFYKIALPSALSVIPVCWFSTSAASWEILLGNLDITLRSALIKAIRQHEKVPVINTEVSLPILKSA